MKKLDQAFYLQDTLTVAKDLIGKYLVHTVDNDTLVCRITEAEAYLGVTDKACHAYGGRQTLRTQAMYLPGGHIYVFLIYGMYDCVNVVTESESNPCAVLLRGAHPVAGLDTIAKLRFQMPYHLLTSVQKTNLLNGPGKLAMGMGIGRHQNKENLFSDDLFIFEKDNDQQPDMAVSTRINIDYAEDYAQKPWRFFDKRFVKK